MNQDSFPEIDETIVRDYLGQIRRTTTNYFLSINHEVEHAKTSEAKHLNISTPPQAKRDFNASTACRIGSVAVMWRNSTSSANVSIVVPVDNRRARHLHSWK